MIVGLKTVPVLWRGTLTRNTVGEIIAGIDTTKQEGFVLRPAGSFPFDAFGAVMGKWVRPNHVTSDEHWKHKSVEWNGIED